MRKRRFWAICLLLFLLMDHRIGSGGKGREGLWRGGGRSKGECGERGKGEGERREGGEEE